MPHFIFHSDPERMLTGMIDTARISELQKELGADCFADIATLFMTDLEIAIETLNPADANVAAQLHLVKGLALNLGFSDLASACRNMEARTTSLADNDALKRLYLASKNSLAWFLRSCGEDA